MRLLRYRLILRVSILVLLLASSSAAVEEPRRVLLLDSYEKEFAPFDVFRSRFRSELVKQFSEPVTFSEVSVEPARFSGDPDERAFLNYLLSSFKRQRLDLIVTIGGPATTFAQKYREQLFPSTPLLFAAVEERIGKSNVTPNSTVVPGRNDFPLWSKRFCKSSRKPGISRSSSARLPSTNSGAKNLAANFNVSIIN
jgi:hypothetical protein